MHTYMRWTIQVHLHETRATLSITMCVCVCVCVCVCFRSCNGSEEKMTTETDAYKHMFAQRTRHKGRPTHIHARTQCSTLVSYRGSKRTSLSPHPLTFAPDAKSASSQQSIPVCARQPQAQALHVKHSVCASLACMRARSFTATVNIVYTHMHSHSPPTFATASGHRQHSLP